MGDYFIKLSRGYKDNGKPEPWPKVWGIDPQSAKVDQLYALRVVKVGKNVIELKLELLEEGK